MSKDDEFAQLDVDGQLGNQLPQQSQVAVINRVLALKEKMWALGETGEQKSKTNYTLSKGTHLELRNTKKL